MQRWNRLKQWLPAILWAIVISAASTDTFSASHTSTFILPVLHWVFPSAGPEALERMHFFIRKSGALYRIFRVQYFAAECSEGKRSTVASALGDLGAGHRRGIFRTG